ncbi:hypothetical protein JOB18_031429 [Solea senegalensis]|uniref:Menorin-like domain-containing protein n=1 Tax=Solea senegalensis TaxID=28829 RepID=A0AAV6QJB7_SOLSE|nr:hypothetical protein JOB18_031429 [Solea senegalensis]
MSEQTLDYFLNRREIKQRDGAEVTWSHGVNSRTKVEEAVTGPTHMLEADVIMRGHDPREPVMAHPPDTDSDITLEQWLEAVKSHHKGIKLDFKSLDAVSPSVRLLEEVLPKLKFPVWVNADVLSGPGGTAAPLYPQAFLYAVSTLPSETVLSLGWTAEWTEGTENQGYSWDMVRAMEEICRDLKHPVTFPVQAARLSQSFSQLTWLLQQSDRYTLTVWSSPTDAITPEDLLLYRKHTHVSRIYYDLPECQRSKLMFVSEVNICLER